MKVVFPASEEMVGEIVKVKISKSGYPFSEGQFVTVVKDFPLQQASNI
jgi:threonylcarbamoyladenosine tRNA methylthiotransferase MtaB